jgi:hypothetical protein
LEVSNILTHKAKVHFFGVGMLVHGGGTLVPLQGVVVAVCALVRRQLPPEALPPPKICASMCRFLAVTTPAATGPGTSTDCRHLPVEGARAPPLAHKHPNAEPGYPQVRAAYKHSSGA